MINRPDKQNDLVTDPEAAGDLLLLQYYETTGDNDALAYTTHAMELSDRRWANHHDQLTTMQYDTLPQTTASYDDHLDLLEPNKLISLALKSNLTTRQWYIFTRWLEGETQDIIAQGAGCSQPTVAREISKIRTDIKCAWESDTNPYRDMRDMLVEVFGLRLYRLVYG